LWQTDRHTHDDGIAFYTALAWLRAVIKLSATTSGPQVHSNPEIEKNI